MVGAAEIAGVNKFRASWVGKVGLKKTFL